MPTGFHAHPHLFSLGREVAIKLLRSLAVFQALLSAISGFAIHKRNLLEARVIIGTYNDHCPAPFYPSLLVGQRHQVYSSMLGAGVVMESITLKTQRSDEIEPAYEVVETIHHDGTTVCE